MYEIGELITQVIGANKRKKLEIVEKLGYKNITRGYHRLNVLIKTGQCPWELHKKLPEALGVDSEVIEKAFQETHKEIQREEEARKREEEAYARATFKPHIYIEHERSVPTSISIVAFIGVDYWKIISLPDDITDKDFTEQERIVREAILKHEKKQISSQFGKAVSYIYRNTYDTSIKFSVDGTVLDRNYQWEGFYPTTELEVGGKKIKGGLLKFCDVC